MEKAVCDNTYGSKKKTAHRTQSVHTFPKVKKQELSTRIPRIFPCKFVQFVSGFFRKGFTITTVRKAWQTVPQSLRMGGFSCMLAPSSRQMVSIQRRNNTAAYSTTNY
jgi:hypothetical protein